MHYILSGISTDQSAVSRGIWTNESAPLCSEIVMDQAENTKGEARLKAALC